MGLTTRQTHTVWGTRGERQEDRWKVTMLVSQPFIHSDGQSASQPFSLSSHGHVCVTAADKEVHYFPAAFCFCSFKTDLSSLDLLVLSFSSSSLVFTQPMCIWLQSSYISMYVNAMNHKDIGNFDLVPFLDLKCCSLYQPLWCQDRTYCTVWRVW